MNHDKMSEKSLIRILSSRGRENRLKEIALKSNPRQLLPSVYIFPHALFIPTTPIALIQLGTCKGRLHCYVT